MKDKILKTTHEKIVENFTFEFPPFILEDEFEKNYTTYTEKLWLGLSSRIVEYLDIFNSENIDTYKELIKLIPESFIAGFRSFVSDGNYKFYTLNRNGEFRESEDKDTERKRLIDFDNEMKLKLYNQIVESRLKPTSFFYINESIWLTSLNEYIQQRNFEIIQIKEYENLSVLFKDVSFGSICKQFKDLDTVKAKFQEIVEECKQRYVNAHGKYWTLLNTFEKYINMESISPFTSWVLNVGVRKWKWNYNTAVNSYLVINKKNEYSFEYKSDGKQIEDIYANIFLLTDNSVTKISVGSTKLLQKTPYLIAKDIQRIDIIEGNIVEIHMHKHFEPEVIVFDTDEEAYKFQTKVSDKRDSRRESRR